MLCRMYEAKAVIKCRALGTPEERTNFGRGQTNCCHILSEFTLQNADPENPAHENEVALSSLPPCFSDCEDLRYDRGATQHQCLQS